MKYLNVNVLGQTPTNTCNAITSALYALTFFIPLFNNASALVL